jgi:hypothetical protein
MSGGSAKREMETGEKATSHGKAPSRESNAKGKEESPPHVKSYRSGDKKKKMMKKVLYYETDSSSPSTSGSDVTSVTSKRHERKKYSKMPLCYPCISKRTPLLSVPLGKPPCFDGEDYCMWSDKMRHHLTSLHASIWDIVEFGAQVPNVGDKDYDSDEVAQIRHFNSQATTILLDSLCREEYNKVQGLKSAKEIWDVLKTAHEGDEVTKITKRETIEGGLSRFVLHQGEEPQAMYNWLKTLVNQVCNLGSTKWDDHEMVKVILRSLVFRNPTQVQLICGDPRYKLMSPEEVIGKFVSFELIIKGSKHIVDLEQGGTFTPEVQPVAIKATEEKKEESTSSRLPIDASKLDNEEMALINKSFCQILKQRREEDYKPRSKRVCYKCGKPGHFIAKCPMSSDSDRVDDKRGKKNEKDELLDSQEEFLIKENKRHVKVKNAYAQEVEKNENLTKELSICHDSITNLRNENVSLNAKIDKLNESISSLKTENASLMSKAKDLNVCNDSISCLRNENAILHAKIEELNVCKPSTSIVDHVTICTRCRDVNVDAINDHIASIKQ